MSDGEKYALMERVNVYQTSQFVHPLTCGNSSLHQNLVPFDDDGFIRLMCNDCNWRQEIPSWLAGPHP